MIFYRILPFIVVLLMGIFMINRVEVASSASQPELETGSVVASEGISMTSQLDVDQGDSVTYTINYSAVPGTGRVEYKMSGMALSDLDLVSMSLAGNVYSDRIVWPFSTIGASGSITIEVKHNDCGAITHSALVLDMFGDPNSSMPSASMTTLVACPGPPPREPAECEGITRRSNGDGNWDSASSWQEGRVPDSNDVVSIQEGHTITAPSGWSTMNIKALCNEGTLKSQPNRSLWMRVTEFVINFETGQIIGQNGSRGGTNDGGRWGSSIGIYAPPGSGVEITNHGLIHSGHGGDGRYGASGGHIWLLGRNVFNSPTGQICSGNGGNSLGAGANPWWARGGDVFIWGHFGAPGFLINNGEICSGDGGNGNPVATIPQRGGDGGCIWLMSRPLLDLSGGSVIGGVGGLGTGGEADSQNGGRGCVRIDPEGMISVRNGAKINGGDVSIYGGDNWVLDLSDSSGTIISATEGITLAVGTNGIVDLGGNTGAILQTEQNVTIFSDEIRIDDNNLLTDVISAATVNTQPAQVLRFVSLAAPQLVAGEAGATLPVEITLQNNGAEADTYDLTIADSQHWTLSDLPDAVTLEGLGSQTLQLEVTAPLQAAHNTTDIITITLTSQSDPTVVDIQLVEVLVENPNVLYLPIISR